jgi:rubrerythrin
MIKTSYVINNVWYSMCGFCGYSMGERETIPDEWEYCPVCGERL